MNSMEDQLLDVDDGSCRDITFPGLSAEGASGLLGFFGTSFKLEEASDMEGETLGFAEARHYVETAASGMLHTFWRSSGLISHLQLFFSWENREFFAEITFFPQDVTREQFSLDRFFQFLEPIVRATNTEELYVRYENVSWRTGDTSKTSGVIFSTEEFRRWAAKGK